ncbi:MTH1187 family thiamine-binding protein [bacterium]|nr:MTH1187 family thiamine-binding protein [candidate division CSSED10-310 bacterium]
MLCQFSISPIGSGESVGKAVSEIIDIIDRSNLPYQTHAMGTIVEGSWDQIMNLIGTCHRKMRSEHNRVITNIHIDDRKESEHRLTGKLESIKHHLNRDICT